MVLWYGLRQLLGYCFSFERYAYVCVFEEIGYLSYFWAVVCKCSPDFACLVLGLRVSCFLLYFPVEFMDHAF